MIRQRRFASVLLFLAAACSSPETPRKPPETATPRTGSQPPAAPPVAPAVWSASVLTSGGYSGHGKGFVLVHSEGRASGRCDARLSEDQRLAVESAVAAAQPDGWKPSYRRTEPSGMTDQFSYSLSLIVEDRKGHSVTHQAGWQDDSFEMLPADLRRLYDSVWTAKEALEKQCP